MEFYNRRIVFRTIFIITFLVFSFGNIFSQEDPALQETDIKGLQNQEDSLEQENININKIYYKKIHPREYNFDFYDFKKSISIKYNKETQVYDTVLDFTSLVENDLPQEGDSVTFYFNGTATKDIDVLYFTIIDSVKDQAEPVNLGNNFQIELKTDIKAKEPFEGKLTVVLHKTATQSFKLYLYYSCNDDEQINIKDKNTLKFVRVCESTNTLTEAKNEKNAIKKNFLIQEISSPIYDEHKELAPKKQSTDYTTPTENLQIIKDENSDLEDKTQENQSEEAENIEPEFDSGIDLAALMEVARENHKSEYKKEYLLDYAVNDILLLPEDEENTTQLIENPDALDENQQTLLMKACKTGNDWQIATLIKSGANVNLKDKDGWTSLMYATRYQENLAVVKLLINANADIRATNNYNSSALILAACYNNNPEILKLLLSKYSSSEKEVLRAFILLLSSNTDSEYTQLAKVNAFISKNIPLNAFYDGKTPLMYACQFCKSTKIIKTLIDNNCMIDIRSAEGKTAFDYAMQNNNLVHDNIFWSLNNKN